MEDNILEYSLDQLRLISLFKEGRYPIGSLGNKILYYLENKSPNEPIHPEWERIMGKEFFRYFDENQIVKLRNLLRAVTKENLFANKDFFDIKLNENSEITFILGAGASAPSGVPTVKELLASLFNKAKKMGNEQLDALIIYCKEHKIENIEDLLTASYLFQFINKNQKVKSLMNYFEYGNILDDSEEEIGDEFQEKIDGIRFGTEMAYMQETLETLFGLLTSTMVIANPNNAHIAITEFIKKRTMIGNCSIITTNYDCCIDEALLKAKVIFNDFMKNSIYPFEKNNKSVNLVKMHGSINWISCDFCQDLYVLNILGVKEGYLNKSYIYPVVGICPKCGGKTRALLVPPISFKFVMFNELIEIWSNAKKIIEKTDYFISIGYSFPEADTYITKLLAHSMNVNKNQKLILIDINPEMSEKIYERFSLQIDNFDKNRIISFTGSCEMNLPPILEILSIDADEDKLKIADKWIDQLNKEKESKYGVIYTFFNQKLKYSGHKLGI